MRTTEDEDYLGETHTEPEKASEKLWAVMDEVRQIPRIPVRAGAPIHRMGGPFVRPRLKTGWAKHGEKRGEITHCVEAWLEDIQHELRGEGVAMAWCFPAAYRSFRMDKYYYPGSLLLVRRLRN